MTCISRPIPESLSRSWMSSSRVALPLMAYSEPPLRNIVREIVTSEYSIGRAPSELSIVSTTSARPSGALPEVPAKMTSSIFPPRSDLTPCPPITQLRASTTLDLPEPLGPTTQVMPGSKLRVVADAKDLNPRKVRLLRYNVPPLDGVSSGEDPAVEGDLPSALRASVARTVPIDCNRQQLRLWVRRRAGPEILRASESRRGRSEER